MFTRIARILALTALVASVNTLQAQQENGYRVRGYVRNQANGEVIRSAVVGVPDLAVRTSSNEYGFYVLELPAGAHVIRARALGYDPQTFPITVRGDTVLDLTLEARPFVLADITVEAEEEPDDIDPQSIEMSTARVSVATLSRVPAVLGEVDPIRSLTLLPGVTNANDAATTFNVRGGGDDQNLILLDESAIFNPAHLFGFFSVFNADAIDDIKLYKGGIPARYGGRLSSVLDVRQREGNRNEFEGRGTVGLLASRLAVEGPLRGGQGSYLVAGRRTYADAFLKLSSDPELRESVAYFYDLNTKINMRFGERTNVFLSGYFGRDRFSVADLFSSDWGNAAGTLRWNQVIGSNLFSNVTASYSDYDYGFEGNFDPSFLWRSRIRTTELKADQSWFITNTQTVFFGVQTTQYEFRPGLVEPAEGSNVNTTELDRRHGMAPAAYLSHEMDLGQRLTFQYGVRVSNFTRQGPENVYQYNGSPIRYNASLGRYEEGEVLDSVMYSDGETIASHTNVEPRASLRIGVSPTTSFKASYNRTNQYLHLVTNTNSPTPIDVWEPTGQHVQPQQADQVAVGYVTTFNDFELSIEAYYKRLQHTVDFIDGADITLNNHLETELVQGEGRAYGLEVYARKSIGKLNGWLSYTLGRSELRFQGVDATDPGINRGEYYAAPHDKLHDLSITAMYPLSDNWQFGTTFVYATGIPVTLPEARYEFGGLLYTSYGDRASSRLPNYHRLDLSFSRLLGGGELVLGIFNAYNRFNAQSLVVRQNVDNPLVAEAVQTAIFGVVPSISWRFTF